MKKLFSTAIAIAAGIIVLLGYFIPTPLFLNLRNTIVHWAVILGGVAIIVGSLNLLSVHFSKITHRDKGSAYSLILITAFMLTLVYGLILGPNHPKMLDLFNAVIFPVEASLVAIMAVTLLYAIIRLLRRRNNLMTIVFVVTALLVLLGAAPLPFINISIFSSFIRPWIVNLPAVAGARGILLGVALGTLLTGLRVLMGTDRPYGGK